MENGNGKHKTESFIDFDNEEFSCYYDITRDKCYYDVNGELLLIIDPKKIQRIKAEYLKQRNIKYAGIGLATIFAGIAVYAIAKYFKTRDIEPNNLIQEF